MGGSVAKYRQIGRYTVRGWSGKKGGGEGRRTRRGRGESTVVHTRLRPQSAVAYATHLGANTE